MESPQQMILSLGSFIVGGMLFGLGFLMVLPLLDWAEGKVSITFWGIIAFLLCWGAGYLIVIWSIRIWERKRYSIHLFRIPLLATVTRFQSLIYQHAIPPTNPEETFLQISLMVGGTANLAARIAGNASARIWLRNRIVWHFLQYYHNQVCCHAVTLVSMHTLRLHLGYLLTVWLAGASG